jgi:hypothetical protein
MLASELAELTGISTPISPGVYAVHRDGGPLYSLGLADRGEGLERLAEDGNNTVLFQAMNGIAAPSAAIRPGTFDMPVGATSRAPARPGNVFEIALSGMPGDRVSFATMFGMSDDWFFATPSQGIALFDEAGMPISGEVTEQIAIYDAGTELDEELGIGPDTGPQQAAPDTGPADPVHLVREVPSSVYGLPASAHLRVTLEPQ